MMSTKTFLAVALAMAAGSGFAALDLPFDSTVIVQGSDTCAELAVRELNEIVQKATSQTFQTSQTSQTSHRIFVGRSPEAERLFGKERFDSLKDEESVVGAKGNDLFLVGGGDLGTLWAVYDFVEDNLGYRWYFSREDGEVVDRTDVVRFTGKATRRAPSFKGFRKIYTDLPKVKKIFSLRNRDSSAAEQFIKGWKYRYTWRVPGHGFILYLPSDKELKGWGNMVPPSVVGTFKDHPEYYSLGKDGKRHSDMQLCLSNPATRDALYRRLLDWMAYKGERGVFMMGSNDFHNDRYCWCEGCIALEKKYDCVGGPLWDTVIDLCARLKRDGHNETYLSSLVYKGPLQTEKAPVGIEKFPANFIADLAFLNSDRTIREYPTQKGYDAGKDFNKWENAQKWAKLCDRKSYWYYGSGHVAQVWQRMHKEILELRELGVGNAGACGAGGGFAFEDMTYYLFLQMLYNPDRDWRTVVNDMLRVKFGPAAPMMAEYMDAAYASLVKNGYPKSEILLGYGDPIGGSSFVQGEEIAAWQKLFDDAEKTVGGEEPYAKHLRTARIDLDVWNVMFAKKVRTAVPGYAFDVAALDTRARTAEKALLAERKMGHDFSGRAAVALDAFANFSTLKSDKLPDELKDCDPEKVTLFLPPKKAKRKCGPDGRSFYWKSEEDPLAASGFASIGRNQDRLDYSKGVLVQVYNDTDRGWYKSTWLPCDKLRKDAYTLFKVGTCKIGGGVHVVIGSDWDSPLNTTQLSRLYDPTYENRQYEIWVSLRAEGPKFIPGDTCPNRLLWDRIYTVDKGVPQGK